MPGPHDRRLILTQRLDGSGTSPGLALFGPVAVRVQGRRPSRPRCCGVCRGAMMRRRSSSSSSLVWARGIGRWGWSGAVRIPGTGRWGGPAQCGHQLVGFPTGQDGVDASWRPGKLVFQHGVGAGAGLAYAVLDVGQRAHGELQAVGQVGAVAVAQCYVAAHDVVAEPFEGASVHAGIMTHEGGNVEPPCPVLSVHGMQWTESYFLGTPARSARTWVTVSQKVSSTFSLDRRTTSTLGALGAILHRPCLAARCRITC